MHAAIWNSVGQSVTESAFWQWHATEAETLSLIYFMMSRSGSKVIATVACFDSMYLTMFLVYHKTH